VIVGTSLALLCALLTAAVAAVAWGVTFVLCIEKRRDLARCIRKDADIAKARNVAQAMTTIAPFLEPVMGSAFGIAATAAASLLRPGGGDGGRQDDTANDKLQRSLAGINSALHASVVERFAPPLVAELETAAIAKLVEHQRKHEAEAAQKAQRQAPHPTPGAAERGGSGFRDPQGRRARA
jgi:hypothetical protein